MSIFKGPGTRRDGEDSVRLQAAITRMATTHDAEMTALQARCDQETARADHFARIVAGTRWCSCPQRLHPPFLIRTRTPVPCPWCVIDGQAQQLRALTPAPETTRVPAVADLPGSVFAAPEPEPVIEAEPRIVADTPTGPVDSEAADVNAQTQATDVRALRAAMGLASTAVLPVVAVPPEQPREPVDTSAARLEAARMVPQLADPDRLVGFATSDLKDAVTVASFPGRSIAVRLNQTT